MEKLAVFGNPIAHSLSPFIHHEFGKQCHIDLQYEKRLIPINQFETEVEAFFRENGKGLNITLPFKERAFQMLPHTSERAKLAGSVNTIMKNGQGELYGDNTDGVGLINDIQHNLGVSLGQKRILLLGAGGAARGAIAPLLSLKPKQLYLANRTLEKTFMLKEQFHHLGTITILSWQEIIFENLNSPVRQFGFQGGASVTEDASEVCNNLESLLFEKAENSSVKSIKNEAPFDIIINSTSLGLANQEVELNPRLVDAHSFCYDMIYGQEYTPFMKWAKKQDVKHVYSGLGMLIEQAAEAFFLWFGVRPNTKEINKSLVSLLS